MPRQLTYAEEAEAFARFRAANAHPKGELEHLNAFTLLVAVALSAQATDASVNRATRDLFPVVDTPAKMLALGEEGLIPYIRSVGLYRTKARNVMRLAALLVERFGGVVPSSRAALESLPGVGRKTANVVLNMWWGFPSQPVDTHVFRVSNRTGIALGADVVAVERALENHVPVEFQPLSHHWLILHGRYVCLARRPRCGACLIRDLCTYDAKTDATAPAAPEPSDVGEDAV